MEWLFGIQVGLDLEYIHKRQGRTGHTIHHCFLFVWLYTILSTLIDRRYCLYTSVCKLKLSLEKPTKG